MVDSIRLKPVWCSGLHKSLIRIWSKFNSWYGYMKLYTNDEVMDVMKNYPDLIRGWVMFDNTIGGFKFVGTTTDVRANAPLVPYVAKIDTAPGIEDYMFAGLAIMAEDDEPDVFFLPVI